MDAITSAVPDTTERPPCERCEGSGARRIWHADAWHVVSGDCPECRGSGLGPWPREVVGEFHAADAVLRTLRGLGFDRAEWQNSKIQGAKEKRAEIRKKIRAAVSRGERARLTYDEMAKEVGVSRQHLDNIRREDPTGRNRG